MGTGDIARNCLQELSDIRGNHGLDEITSRAFSSLM
jgi:hypothetical protein